MPPTRPRLRCLLIAATALAVPAWLAEAKKTELVLVRIRNLAEREIRPGKLGGAAPSRTITIQPVTDSRGLSDPSLVGENRQKAGRTIPVRSKMPVADFATEALRAALAEWGVRLAPDSELVLKGELVTLLVVEENKYAAEARLRFKLQDRTGNLLWEGISAGDDFTWGRDLNPENYEQTISNSLKKAYAALLDNPGFQAAWSGKAVAAGAKEIVTAAVMKDRILALMKEGLGVEVIVSYVRGRRVSPALTPGEILDWKRTGIPEAVIKTAVEAE